jgi:CubicO group peptidase (beta-lactamase class C family)
MRLVLPATCALVAALLAPALHADDRLGPVLDKLTQTLQAEVQRRELPSLSVAIVRDRDVVYRHAFGYADLARQVPATLENVYPVGSITKVFVAAMLMQLVERGVVRLDDPVTKYVPEYRVSSSMAATQPATLRQLAFESDPSGRITALSFALFRFAHVESN